jgi:hypothetical protein
MRQKIYYCLEQKCGIRKKGIPFRIKKFTYVLEKIVGSGASLLEARIITSLYSKASSIVKCCRPSGI